MSLVLLNTVGYYLLFVGFEYRNDILMSRQLDDFQYEDSSSITIKIPIAVPYLADDTEFVRVEGKYEYHGEFYRMVKQKYAQDTLVIVCVRDQENKRIHGAMADYVKTFADKPADHQTHAKLILSFNKDYIQHKIEVKSSTAGWVSEVTPSSFCKHLIPTYTSNILHPPERG